jgi:hypothetical protein
MNLVVHRRPSHHIADQKIVSCHLHAGQYPQHPQSGSYPLGWRAVECVAVHLGGKVLEQDRA